jgi:hypothetical protein
MSADFGLLLFALSLGEVGVRDAFEAIANRFFPDVRRVSWPCDKFFFSFALEALRGS